MQVATVNYGSKSAAAEFAESLKNTGFAVLTNHPVPWELVEACYEEWRILLKNMDKSKPLGQLFDQEKQDGYFGISDAEKAKGRPVRDLKHYYQLYFPWGRYPEQASDNAKKLFTELFALGKELLQWIDDYMDENVRLNLCQKMGQPNFKLAEHALSFERTMMRILHYPSYDIREVEKGAVRAAAHEDINLITVLPCGSSKGLQVKLGKEWFDVPTGERNIIVNIGDMLQEMTNGVFKSTTHRVIVDHDAIEDDAISTDDEAITTAIMSSQNSTQEQYYNNNELLYSPNGNNNKCKKRKKEKNIDSTNMNSCPNASPYVSEDRMSIPCFMHAHAECYLSERYPTAEQFLTERLKVNYSTEK